MRVCFLTHYFPPEVGAPQTRIELLARTLANRGAAVVVHTGFPHYPSGVITPPYRNRPWLIERRDGIRVVRTPVYPAANRGMLKRLVNHASFAASAVAGVWLSGPIDVVVAETPPLFTAAAGAVYAALKRSALVVNVADRWPASAVELGMLRQREAVQAAEWLERWIYSRADLVVAPTAGIVAALGQLPQSQHKARRTWPVVEVDRFPAADAPAPPTPALRVLYVGTVGLAQGLDVLVQASALAGSERVHTTIAGDGAEADQIRSVVAARRLSNVHMLGRVRAQRVPELYAQSDACAVILRDRPILAGALPTKLVEAMAAGRAIVLAARGESAELVRRTGAGLVVSPEDPDALAGALLTLQRDRELCRRLGRAGRRFAEENFGAGQAAEEWTAVLEDAVYRHRTRGEGPGG